MKTTKEIHQMYEMNNESEKDISKDKWYSEKEIKKVLANYLTAFDENGNAIETRYFRHILNDLFGDEE